MVGRELRKVGDDLIAAHAGSDVLEHVVDSKTSADEARPSATYPRLHVDQRDQVHKWIVVPERGQPSDSRTLSPDVAREATFGDSVGVLGAQRENRTLDLFITSDSTMVLINVD